MFNGECFGVYVEVVFVVWERVGIVMGWEVLMVMILDVDVVVLMGFFGVGKMILVFVLVGLDFVFMVELWELDLDCLLVDFVDIFCCMLSVFGVCFFFYEFL